MQAIWLSCCLSNVKSLLAMRLESNCARESLIMIVKVFTRTLFLKGASNLIDVNMWEIVPKLLSL